MYQRCAGQGLVVTSLPYALLGPLLLTGFYLISPSEFERFSLSARNITEPLCSLDISWPRDAARPGYVRSGPLIHLGLHAPGVSARFWFGGAM